MRCLHFFPVIALLIAAPAWAQMPAAADVPHNDKPFGLWLAEFQKDARGQGIAQATLDDAFATTQPLDRVVALDHAQPETVLTLPQYLKNVVTDKRVAEGRQLLKENRKLLTAIGRRYGVQPRFIVALWGIETNYGANTGGFRTVDALATLAYDGRRSEFFRGELLDALRILQQEHMAADDMKGSWAGAMGQCQFMPSSYLKFAVDYDHNGRRDIWNSKPDIFASVAHYLHTLGWKSAHGWGRAVTLAKGNKGLDPAHATMDRRRTVSQWDKAGVRTASRRRLPKSSMKGALIYIGDSAPAGPYLVYDNFKALLQWNRSRFFAAAVGALADRIGL